VFGIVTVPGQRAPARLPPPVLVRLVGAAVRLACELGVDVGALPLLVHRPRRLVVHPLPLPDVAPRGSRAHRERQRPGPVAAALHNGTDDTGKEEISPVLYPTTFFELPISSCMFARHVPGRRRGGTAPRRRRAPARGGGASLMLLVLGSVTWVYRDATRRIGIWCLLRYQSVTEVETACPSDIVPRERERQGSSSSPSYSL
jgi:hypothetical protein